MSVGLINFGGSEGRACCQTTYIPWLLDTSFLRISPFQPPLPCHIDFLTLLPPSFKDPCGYIGSTQVIQNMLHQFKILKLTTCAKLFLPYTHTFQAQLGCRHLILFCFVHLFVFWQGGTRHINIFVCKLSCLCSQVKLSDVRSFNQQLTENILQIIRKKPCCT